MYIIVFSLNFLTAETHLIPGDAKLNEHIYLKVPWLRNLNLRMCYFGIEVLLLFPQMVRTCGFLPILMWFDRIRLLLKGLYET